MMWLFSRKGPSGFSAISTAEEVTHGIDGAALTAIVTGASSGIGAETARVLALRGVHVVMGVRNMSAAKEVKEAIIKQVPSAKIEAMELDLSSLASVRTFASEFNSSGLPLNILINNAGIMATPFMLSQDKIELQFATNHLGHFLLTNLLLGRMKGTAHRTSREGRIVNVSSRRHKFSYPEGIRFEKINDESGYNSLSAYGQSKLSNVLHANELARRLKIDGTDITANSIHPGAIATNLFRHSMLFKVRVMKASSDLWVTDTFAKNLSGNKGVVNILGRYLVKGVQQGAATTCYVSLHPDIKGMSGKYFSDCNIAETGSQGNDTEMAKKLWDLSLGFTD